MGQERWFRGQHDGQNRPFDWLTAARQQGIPEKVARALYERALQQAHGAAPGRVQELYLALLADAHRDASRPSPGKVTRTMRHAAAQAGNPRGLRVSQLTGQPIAPGKRTLTSYIEPARDERGALDAQRASARLSVRDLSVPDALSDRRLQAHLAAAFGHFEEQDALDQNRIAAEPETAVETWQPRGVDRGDIADAEGNHGEHRARPRRELPFRFEMERLFGERLDEIRIEQDGALPRGARAAAERNRIAFADAAPSRATVAHEVAHVLQYRRGEPRTAARLGERGDPAEREARHAATAVLAGRSVQIRGVPTAQMHLEDPEEDGEDEAELGVTVIAHGIELSRRGDGLDVMVWWWALLHQEGREHRPLRDGELPPQLPAPRLRATRLIQRLEEHAGRRMLQEGRQALLARREIPLTQRDPYSYTADLSAGDLQRWFGTEAWQGFLDGRGSADDHGDTTAPDGDATPTVTTEEVLRHLAEERWDVDDLAAQLTDGQMRSLSATDRVNLVDFISDGYSVLNEDEQTIVRLLATTPPEQARAVRDRLGTGLLQQLDDAIDFDDYREYNDALRQLFFDSLTPEEADAQMAGAQVFPWANPGLIHALWNRRFYYEECELHDDGKVHISYWINFAGFGLRTQTVRLDPFEMIAVRFFYPEEYAGAEVGETIYMPAINLRSLHRHQFKGDLQTAVDVGLLAAGGAGLIGAGTRLARIIAALDLAAAAADITIREFRQEIARTEQGRDFLAAWDVVSTLITVYGVARVAMHAPAALRRLRTMFERFRAAPPPLPADTMRRIESEVDDVLRQADEAEEAAAAGQTSQTSGADDTVDAATGQHSTTSTGAGDLPATDGPSPVTPEVPTTGGNSVTLEGVADAAHEAAQATRFGQMEGGGRFRFLGNSSQGIEGFFTPSGSQLEIPVSLKDFSSTGNLRNILQRINRNAAQVSAAGYAGRTVLHATVRQTTVEQMEAFIGGGPLQRMASEGTFTRLVFECSDGIVEIAASGVLRR
jgi:hypothetical protein